MKKKALSRVLVTGVFFIVSAFSFAQDDTSSKDAEKGPDSGQNEPETADLAEVSGEGQMAAEGLIDAGFSEEETVEDMTSSEKEDEAIQFMIQPGDVVEINVYGTPNMHHPGLLLRVSQEGTIYFPLLGEVSLLGLTALEAAKKLDAMLMDGYLTDPMVSVYIHERISNAKTRTFAISGSVIRPGIYALEGNVKLVDTVNYAEGLLRDADTSKVRVERKEEGEKTTFVMDLYTEGLDFTIKTRDRVFVDSYGKYTIYGEVIMPGTYFISEGLTVADAVLAARGFTRTASKNGVKVIRQTEEGKRKVIKVPVAHIFRTGKKDKDVVLEADDIVVVPESWF